MSGNPSKAKTLQHKYFITTPHFCQEQNECGFMKTAVLGHPSRQVKSSLHFVDLVFWRRNLKLEIGNWKKHKDVDALPNFKFRISGFDIGIQFDNTRFFEKSVN